jgi:hypothetical protein
MALIFPKGTIYGTFSAKVVNTEQMMVIVEINKWDPTRELWVIK